MLCGDDVFSRPERFQVRETTYSSPPALAPRRVLKYHVDSVNGNVFERLFDNFSWWQNASLASSYAFANLRIDLTIWTVRQNIAVGIRFAAGHGVAAEKIFLDGLLHETLGCDDLNFLCR